MEKVPKNTTKMEIGTSETIKILESHPNLLLENNLNVDLLEYHILSF